MPRTRASMPAPAPDQGAPGYWALDGSLPPSERDDYQSADELDREDNFSVMALRRRGVPEDWIDYIAQYPDGRGIRYERYRMEKSKQDRRENRSRIQQKLEGLARRRRGFPEEGPPVEVYEMRGLLDENGVPLPQLVFLCVFRSCSRPGLTVLLFGFPF